MIHYFTQDGDILTPIVDFQISAGVVRGDGRVQPDTFLLKSTTPLDTAEGFIVLREDAMMYDCEAYQVTASGSPVTISIAGVVRNILVAPERNRALEAIKKADER